MTPHQIELARRLVSLSGWVWPWQDGGLPGYARANDGGWVAVDDAGDVAKAVECLPDLNDSRVLGYLLGLVRRAWGDGTHLVRLKTHVPDGIGGTERVLWWALALYLSEPRRFYSPDGCSYFICAPTEPEALINALAAKEG